MTSTAQVLEIVPITNKSGLKSCSPNLMPFHIDYSGKAPISTYLRVEPAKENPGTPEPEAKEESQATLLDSQESQETVVGDQTQTTVDSQAADNTGTRFITSFRGRTIQGLDVQLPEGYTGVVLKVAGSNSTTNEDIRLKPKKGTNLARKTRSSGFVHDVDNNVEEYDEAMDVDSGSPLPADEDHSTPRDTRTLIPTSQFSTIRIWHPDHPVDEGRDEYYRSLQEWTRLAHEIHQAD